MAFFAGDPSFPLRFGTDVRDTSDDRGLFLKVFSGEVLNAFNEANITERRMLEKTITQGKSDQFPKTWKTETEYHTPGQEMLGQDTEETENVITVDKTLVSHIGISDIDEAMSHFQVRQEYTRQLGEAVSKTVDKNRFRTAILTSRNQAANGVNYGVPANSSFPSGFEIDDAEIAGSLTALGGEAYWQAFRRASVYAGNHDINENDVMYGALPPAAFDALQWAQTSTGNHFVLQNRDFHPAGESQGAIKTMLQINNIRIFRSNNIPQVNEASDTSVFSKYRGDFSGVLGVVWHPSAVGTVKLRGMQTAMQRDERRGEDFIVTRTVMGHGPVRNLGAMSIIPTGVGTAKST